MDVKWEETVDVREYVEMMTTVQTCVFLPSVTHNLFITYYNLLWLLWLVLTQMDSIITHNSRLALVYKGSTCTEYNMIAFLPILCDLKIGPVSGQREHNLD